MYITISFLKTNDTTSRGDSVGGRLDPNVGAAVYVARWATTDADALSSCERELPSLHNEGFEYPRVMLQRGVLAFSLLGNSETRFRVDADSVSVRLRACGLAAVGWPQDPPSEKACSRAGFAETCSLHDTHATMSVTAEQYCTVVVTSRP